MQIIDNKALLLRVKEPERITAVINNAKKLSANEVLVRWGVEEAQILKNLRLKDIAVPHYARLRMAGIAEAVQASIRHGVLSDSAPTSLLF